MGAHITGQHDTLSLGEGIAKVDDHNLVESEQVVVSPYDVVVLRWLSQFSLIIYRFLMVLTDVKRDKKPFVNEKIEEDDDVVLSLSMLSTYILYVL